MDSWYFWEPCKNSFGIRSWNYRCTQCNWHFSWGHFVTKWKLVSDRLEVVSDWIESELWPNWCWSVTKSRLFCYPIETILYPNGGSAVCDRFEVVCYWMAVGLWLICGQIKAVFYPHGSWFVTNLRLVCDWIETGLYDPFKADLWPNLS